MKLPSIFRPKHSIAGRLTLRVTVTILLVFAVISAVIAAVVWFVGIYMGVLYYEGALKTSNERITNVFTSVETAIINNVPEVEKNLQHPDDLYAITERILKLNPNITGSAIAFEPNYYKEKGLWYSPYSYREDSVTIVSKQLGNKDYEYHYMDWYQIPKLLGTPYWSEPYFDTGGGEKPMTTYSLPLYDSMGNLYAIITADVSLDWLSDMTHRMDSLNNVDNTMMNDERHAYSFIISRGGTYITHPNKERILNETIFSYCMETDTEKDDSLAYEMIEGKEDYGGFREDGQAKFVFFAPIKHVGWSMATVIPMKELYEAGNIFSVVILILMAIGIVVVFLVCYHTIIRMTKPLTRFACSADEIAQGKIDVPLPIITTHDEMRRLHDSFKTMQFSLMDQIEEVKQINEQKGRIESELMIARNIQMSMLPKTFPAFPNRDDVDIYGMLTPAKEVGGDLYDFFIRDEKLYFCIGDVSGKGVPASLLMAVTRSLFRSVSVHNSSPAYIVSQINDAMAETNDTMMFVTLFVGVLDLPTGRLRYCNAGHCAPVLTGAGVGLLNIKPNLPLGIMGGYKFEAQESIIFPGTTIFLYTDGLTEAENVDKELFDEQRMLDVCQNIYEHQLADTTPPLFVDAMTDAVHDFVKEAEQSDDLTMLAIRYTKIKEETRLHRTLTLPNDIETIPQLNQFMDEVCEEVGFDMSTTMSLNLAMEEAVVNVMTYAYPEGTKGEVRIDAVANDRRAKFIISDRGVPFDPTAKAEADTTLSVEERPIGGLGIHLVRQIMDSVNYEYVGGMNILTLRKFLNTQN